MCRGSAEAGQLNAFSIVYRRTAAAVGEFGSWLTQLTADERELK
jgi:hypothetical protein